MAKTVIDLFSGCGGMSLGFQNDGHLEERSMYVDGMKNGECEERDMRGRLITRKFYEDNSLTHDATLPLKEKSYRKLIGEK